VAPVVVPSHPHPVAPAVVRPRPAAVAPAAVSYEDRLASFVVQQALVWGRYDPEVYYNQRGCGRCRSLSV
jgi:hypothetical protein